MKKKQKMTARQKLLQNGLSDIEIMLLALSQIDQFHKIEVSEQIYNIFEDDLNFPRNIINQKNMKKLTGRVEYQGSLNRKNNGIEIITIPIWIPLKGKITTYIKYTVLINGFIICSDPRHTHNHNAGTYTQTKNNGTWHTIEDHKTDNDNKYIGMCNEIDSEGAVIVISSNVGPLTNKVYSLPNLDNPFIPNRII